MSKRADTCKNRAKVAAKRLNTVLEKEFDDDKNLMAFVCGTSIFTLNGWLSGRHAPQDLRGLTAAIPKYSSAWLCGMTDENVAQPKEYWESIPLEYQYDVFRRDVLLVRMLVQNRKRIQDIRRANENRSAGHGEDDQDQGSA